MGWQDRDYARGGGTFGGPGGFGGRGGRYAVTTWLLIINVAVFIIGGLMAPRDVQFPGYIMRMPALEAMGYFSIRTAFEDGQIWRLLTYQFLHAGFGHLLGNMIGLYFFGYMVEQWLGGRRFLLFYQACVLGGAVAYVALAFGGVLNTNVWTPMIGASAGVFGVLLAATRIAPDTRVMLLIPPIPMKLKTLAWIMLALAVYTVWTAGKNAGGEAAHLGGAAVGYLLAVFPQLLGGSAGGTGGGAGGGRGGSRKPRVDPVEIDRILDKVRAHGVASLTEREKQLLQRATDDR